MKIVADAGNGMAGKIIPAIFEGLPFELVPLYFDLDGHFPNHTPPPFAIPASFAFFSIACFPQEITSSVVPE